MIFSLNFIVKDLEIYKDSLAIEKNPKRMNIKIENGKIIFN